MGQGGTKGSRGEVTRKSTPVQVDIHKCILKNDSVALKALMESKPDINMNEAFVRIPETYFGEELWVTPLAMALMENAPDCGIVYALLQSKSILLTLEAGGMTYLDYAVSNCNDLIVQTLLADPRSNVNLTVRPENPPFAQAVFGRRTELFPFFLKRQDLVAGVEMVARQGLTGVEREKLLMPNDNKPEEPGEFSLDLFKEIVAHPAFRLCASELVVPAIEAESPLPYLSAALGSCHLDINKAVNGMTPLSMAVNVGYEAAARVILTHPQVDPNRGLSVTPLVLAIRRGLQSPVIHAFLKNPMTDVNVGFDDTPLMAAVESNQPDSVALLLSHPTTNVNLVMAKGLNALSTALYASSEMCIEAEDPEIDLTKDEEEPSSWWEWLWGKNSAVRREEQVARRWEVLKMILSHPESDPRFGVGTRFPLNLARAHKCQPLLGLFEERLKTLPEDGPAMLEIPEEVKSKAEEAVTVAEEASDPRKITLTAAQMRVAAQGRELSELEYQMIRRMKLHQARLALEEQRRAQQQQQLQQQAKQGGRNQTLAHIAQSRLVQENTLEKAAGLKRPVEGGGESSLPEGVESDAEPSGSGLAAQPGAASLVESGTGDVDPQMDASPGKEKKKELHPIVVLDLPDQVPEPGSHLAPSPQLTPKNPKDVEQDPRVIVRLVEE